MMYTDSKMIDVGYSYLEQGDFAKAYHTLNKLSLSGTHSSRVQWGLLLATHYCKNDAELAGCGIPITKDDYYIHAYAFGTAEEKERYAETARLVLMCTHLYIYQHTIEEKDIYLARKWIKRYNDATSGDDPFQEIYRHLLSHCQEKEQQPYFTGLIVDLYRCYEQDVMQFKKTTKSEKNIIFADKLMEILGQYIKTAFQARMDALYEQIAKPVVTKPLCEMNKYEQLREMNREILERSGLNFCIQRDKESEKAADAAALIWANPCGEYSKLTGRAVAMVNLDDYGITEGERWIALAERLWASPHKYKVSVYNYIASMYTKAEEAGTDAVLVSASRDKMLNDIAVLKNICIEDIKFLLKYRPQDAELHWRRLILETDNLTLTSRKNVSKYIFDDDEPASLRKPSVDELRNDIGRLKGSLESLSKDEKALKETYQPFADQAISCADGEKAGEYQRQWDAYLQRIEKAFADKRMKINEKIAYLERECVKTQKRSKIIGIIGLTIIILLVCAICTQCVIGNQ